MNRALLTLVGISGCVEQSAAEPQRPSLEVTHGDLVRKTDYWSASAPAVRAVARGSTGNAAVLGFVYRGPSDERASLASGAEREQVGLKLRAQDSCNLIYVMWRVDPPAITVQLKRNPGAQTNEECGNRGYRWLRGEKLHAKSGEKVVRPPALITGLPHVLAGTIVDDTLVVTVDGVTVWRGVLPEDARDLTGPAGLRTDNVRADLVLAADSVLVDTKLDHVVPLRGAVEDVGSTP